MRVAIALPSPSRMMRPEIGLRYSCATLSPSGVALYVIEGDSGGSVSYESCMLALRKPKMAGPRRGLSPYLLIGSEATSRPVTSEAEPTHDGSSSSHSSGCSTDGSLRILALTLSDSPSLSIIPFAASQLTTSSILAARDSESSWVARNVFEKNLPRASLSPVPPVATMDRT